jgi:CTP:molybdopterin cytidylyltransferase MocA
VIGREMIETFLKAPISYTAREVEHSKQDKIDYLPVSDAAVSANIDTPDDYARLQR